MNDFKPSMISFRVGEGNLDSKQPTITTFFLVKGET